MRSKWFFLKNSDYSSNVFHCRREGIEKKSSRFESINDIRNIGSQQSFSIQISTGHTSKVLVAPALHRLAGNIAKVGLVLDIFAKYYLVIKLCLQTAYIAQ